jgi:hypothetical protein
MLIAASTLVEFPHAIHHRISKFMMVTSRTRILLLMLGSVFAVLVLAGIILYLEPFAPRCQGRTVDQWLAFYGENRKEPERAVMDAFGANALPALIKAYKYPFWWDMSDRLRNKSNFLKRLTDKPRAKAHVKMLAAHIWAAQFFAGGMNGNIIANLLIKNTNDDFVLQAVRFYEVGLGQNPLLPFLNTRDETVGTRARKLFKSYKHWDDATYQKWHQTQTNHIDTWEPPSLHI